MKDSIKREQRQAVLHFAERENQRSAAEGKANSRATLKKKLFLLFALLCAVAQGAWVDEWATVYSQTQTTAANWTALDAGSTTGHTLGSAGNTTYFYVTGNLTFTNSNAGGSGGGAKGSCNEKADGYYEITSGGGNGGQNGDGTYAPNGGSTGVNPTYIEAGMVTTNDKLGYWSGLNHGDKRS